MNDILIKEIQGNYCNEENTKLREELLAKGYPTDKDDNFPTYENLYNMLQTVFITKACDWLENNFRRSPYDNTKVITHFSNIDEVIEDFRKAMEE